MQKDQNKNGTGVIDMDTTYQIAQRQQVVDEIYATVCALEARGVVENHHNSTDELQDETDQSQSAQQI